MLARLNALPTYLRYGAASVFALGSDLGLFLLLLELGMPSVTASACGYGLGVVAHWLLSTRLVFDNGMDAQGLRRMRQKSLFVGTALLGLVITMGIVGLGTQLGLDPRAAKLIAVVVSFQTTYMARRTLIFRT